MKLSKKFLNDFIDINDIDYHELADKMVFAGNEYESICKISSATGVVIGYVETCINHPDSNRLHICQVNVGNEVIQILCGAPNVQAGQKVVVALPGAKLPGGIEIKKAKLAGMDSCGMICSFSELGIEAKYQSEEDKKGIHVLGEDAVVGEDPIHYLGFDDEVIDFELTADRADLMSVLGMAYEVGAIYDREVHLPEVNLKEEREDINTTYHLEVKTDACPIYLGRKVSDVVIKESPAFIQRRLMASGIRPINNVVDISNYVMLEYGQPLHFFDADRLGTNIIVRMADKEEKMRTLDGKEHTLSESDIVIANKDKAVALAGVMGGLDTEVEEGTKDIFIEAAIFDAQKIRYTSKKILRSEASSRYEKGIDPNRTLLALNRAAYLLETYASGKVHKGILAHDVIDKSEKKVVLSLEKICGVLGMNLNKEDVQDSLRRLGFTYEYRDNTFYILIPTRRLDVTMKEDVIAEIGKIYGYHHVVGSLPHTKIKRGTMTKKAQKIKEMRNRLCALGLNQVITYSLIGEQDASLFGPDKGEKITLLSPMSEDKKIMRQTLIPSLLQVYEYNRARSIRDISIFEIGSAYYKREDNYEEETLVSGLLYGIANENTWNGENMKMDFYYMKGIVENILDYFGLGNRYTFEVDAQNVDLHPGRSCSIYVEKKRIGFLGMVHPKHCKKEVYVFEFSLNQLMEKKIRGIKFKEIPKYPSVKKDLAFIVDEKLPSSEIMQVIQKSVGKVLTHIDVFDVYTGDNVAHGKKSIAYSLTFCDPKKTLNEEEINTLFHKIICDVESKLDAKLRDQ